MTTENEMPDTVDIYTLADGRQGFGKAPPLGVCVSSGKYVNADKLAKVRDILDGTEYMLSPIDACKEALAILEGMGV